MINNAEQETIELVESSEETMVLPQVLGVVPREEDLALIGKEVGVTRVSVGAGYEIRPGVPVWYDIHAINQPDRWPMKYVLVTAKEQGRRDPIACGDSPLSHLGEYYDLNYYFERGCFGSRNQALTGYKNGVPDYEARWGEGNLDGKKNLLVSEELPEGEARIVTMNLILTSRMVARLLGARYYAPNVGRRAWDPDLAVNGQMVA